MRRSHLRARPASRPIPGVPLIVACLALAAAGCSDAPPFDLTSTRTDPPTIVQVAAGRGSWCLVDEEGIGRCWGDNRSGQLGDGTRTRNRLPTRLAGDVSFRQIGPATFEHRCGVAVDGRAYCWGANGFGELGIGEAGDRSTEPVPVAGDARFQRVASGVAYSCGLSTTGRVWCWGQNRRGQQGTGEPGTPAPTPAAGDRTFVDLAVGDEYVCGVDEAGDAYCSGLNDAGQLGRGTATPPGPVGEEAPDPSGRFRRVVGGHSFRSVAARFDHTCGITVDGHLYCWGSHRDFQLGALSPERLDRCEVEGDATIPCMTEPVRVPLPGSETITHVSVGFASTCVTTDLGQALCWGRGSANPVPAEAAGQDEDFVTVHTFGFGGSACALAASGRVYCGQPVSQFPRPWLEVRYPEEEG